MLMYSTVDFYLVSVVDCGVITSEDTDLFVSIEISNPSDDVMKFCFLSRLPVTANHAGTGQGMRKERRIRDPPFGLLESVVAEEMFSVNRN